MKNLRSNAYWILSIILLILIANLNFIAAVFTPSPLVYQGSPFPINKEAGYVFSPLDSIPVIATRCNTTSDNIVIIAVRVLVNDATGDTQQYPPSTAIAPPGCMTYYPLIDSVDTVYNKLPAGKYHFRAVSTVVTQFRTFNIPWETESFHYDPGKK